VPTLAITLQGRGTLYRFDDRRAAELHPIIQFGDAIFSTGYELIDEYRLVGDLFDLIVAKTEPHLCLRQRFEKRVTDLTAEGKTPRQVRHVLEDEGLLSDLHSALARVAQLPPDDPATIVERITSDREAYLKERHHTMAKAAAAVANGAPKEPKAPKAPKEPSEKKIAGLLVATKITFGVAPDTTEKDKEGKETVVAGKSYDGTKNNPKRTGSKSDERFALYKKNMTIAQALEAGVTAADIANDLEHKFIVTV
jgi:hypothetical protein